MVLDWELSILGVLYVDVVFNCLFYYLFFGLEFYFMLDFVNLSRGVLDVGAYVRFWLRVSGFLNFMMEGVLMMWLFYIVFLLF